MRNTIKYYNPKDVTVTIGGVEIKNWESFDFNVGNTETIDLDVFPETTAEELLKDLDEAVRIIKMPTVLLTPITTIWKDKETGLVTVTTTKETHRNSKLT